MASKKPPIPWREIKTTDQLIGVTIALAGGAGLSPYAPGTAGSVVGLAMVWLLQVSQTSIPFQIVNIALLTVIGSWAAQHVVNLTKTSDHQSIVIDEVIGMAIGALTCNANLTSLTIAFFLFRFFDILKLPPVRMIDQWSKTTTNEWKYVRGFGVIADDIVAGLQTLAVMYFIQTYFHLN